MPKPAILSIVTGVPAHQHTQTDMYNRWLAPYINSHRAKAIFNAAEIDTRHSVLPSSEFLANEPGTEARNQLYLETARPLAIDTITRTLNQTNLAPTDINHFIVISCTGLETPGLDVILAAELGMHPNLRRSALIGMGCYAGLTGLDRALLELTARPQNYALVLALEFGTIHFQHGNKIKDMVAAAIFGDGLAAAIIGPQQSSRNQPVILNTMTYTDYSTQDLMGVHLSDKGFQIHLATKVPKVLRNIVPELLDNFLQQLNLNKEMIKFWGIHPGGAKIVDYMGQALALQPEDLRFSRAVLHKYGNMSSATIFFVLDEIIQQGQPAPGDYALLLAFGPGLTIELCLIRW